jgi:23S rRNA pseudouridine1911/1915/1917 synthase
MLNIIFENENYLVVDKPAGLLVYLPLGANPEITLQDMLQSKMHFQEKTGREGIVHRLDRETSGLILVAKNIESQDRLKRLFLDREIVKNYLALVRGKMETPQGEISIPLGRHSKDRLRVIPKEGGRQSTTIFKVIRYYEKNNLSLLDLDLKTGRTHQIRVHFSAIGHPIVGDPKYSRVSDELKRQFLHAHKLSFVDPFTEKPVSFVSAMPEDLNNFLQNIS